MHEMEKANTVLFLNSDISEKIAYPIAVMKLEPKTVFFMIFTHLFQGLQPICLWFVKQS